MGGALGITDYYLLYYFRAGCAKINSECNANMSYLVLLSGNLKNDVLILLLLLFVQLNTAQHTLLLVFDIVVNPTVR